MTSHQQNLVLIELPTASPPFTGNYLMGVVASEDTQDLLLENPAKATLSLRQGPTREAVFANEFVSEALWPTRRGSKVKINKRQIVRQRTIDPNEDAGLIKAYEEFLQSQYAQNSGLHLADRDNRIPEETI